MLLNLFSVTPLRIENAWDCHRKLSTNYSGVIDTDLLLSKCERNCIVASG